MQKTTEKKLSKLLTFRNTLFLLSLYIINCNGSYKQEAFPVSGCKAIDRGFECSGIQNSIQDKECVFKGFYIPKSSIIADIKKLSFSVGGKSIKPIYEKEFSLTGTSVYLFLLNKKTDNPPVITIEGEAQPTIKYLVYCKKVEK